MSERTFTKTELAEYNGVQRPEKYVAIDGLVYDLTEIPTWSGANHHGNVAGQDLSAIIVNAPHKKSVLAKLTVVGKYLG
ncbi:cytochrome b5 domain-containing protein [Lapidilactobacillus gannanensis]|uniref:Cytochrome b5 domain-containing protein n=1 Tax=Lapidilactobacillus gannanensis TaxID=2486002 RepID=A0ABW4BPW4_9LACO|nr:cytochrome b5 domain-containing protein [Lapidilactobacillus gannanensis]MCH4056839.1 cytochrome B5 [Lactobacillaceae bacterium]